jgi:hypothetical protein
MKADQLVLMLCEAERSAKRLIQKDDPYNALQMLELIYALEEALLKDDHAAKKQTSKRVPA